MYLIDVCAHLLHMAQFTARSVVDATPEQVLEVLTDPEEIRSWSPIPFEVNEFGGRRLHPGSVARVQHHGAQDCQRGDHPARFHLMTQHGSPPPVPR